MSACRLTDVLVAPTLCPSRPDNISTLLLIMMGMLPGWHDEANTEADGDDDAGNWLNPKAPGRSYGAA